MHINRCKLNFYIQLLEQQISPTEIMALALLERCCVWDLLLPSVVWVMPSPCPPRQGSSRARPHCSSRKGKGRIGGSRMGGWENPQLICRTQAARSHYQGEKQVVSKYYFLPLNLEENARDLWMLQRKRSIHVQWSFSSGFKYSFFQT